LPCISAGYALAGPDEGNGVIGWVASVIEPAIENSGVRDLRRRLGWPLALPTGIRLAP
jgi:hypothetical protein